MDGLATDAVKADRPTQFEPGIGIAVEPYKRARDADSGPDEAPPGGECPASDAEAARKALIETAETHEGPFAAVFLDIVKAVEGGDQPFSVADRRICETRPGQHRFAAETRTPYLRWRAARAAASAR